MEGRDLSSPRVDARLRQLARERSDEPAVVDGSATRSYSDLNRQVSSLASRLRDRELPREAVVGVIARHRAEALVGMLAVWRAGGVYLPIEVSAPPDRVDFVLKESGARLALVGTGCDLPVDGLPSEPVSARSDQVADTDPSTMAAHDDQAAYIIYTSGTTGAPKGVCVSHRALAAHLEGVARRFGLQPDDKVLQFAATHVDVALEQCLAALWTGATVVVHDGQVPSPRDFFGMVVDIGITVANLPAGYWNALADSLNVLSWPEQSKLRLMISGSDRMSTAAVSLWLDRAPHDVALMNAYGPTEAVITATACDIDRTPVDTAPIGTAVGGRTLHVLRPTMELCPDGVAGELYIGGPELARGYVSRPGLTADRFVPDPFGPHGGRLYRTGDVVRLSRDGSMEFLGRADDQVKVRGHRVEPGEVEATFAGHPRVVECVVRAQTDPAGERRLVGYVSASEPRPAADELRKFGSRRLPCYMIPVAWVFVESMPLTTNGKVDRDALPEASLESVDDTTSYASPRGPVEELLAGLWADVLGVDRIGVNDSFFGLGGDSLAAVRVLTRLLPIFGSSVSAYTIFEAETLAQLARALDQSSREPGESLPELRRGDGDSDAPLSYGQQALWFMDRWDPGQPTYNVPWVFRLSGQIETEALEHALRAIVHRHDVLRSVFPSSMGEPSQVVRSDVEARLRIVDLADHASEPAVAAAVHEEAVRPFDLERGPLLRACLIREDEQHAVLVVVLHHIVWDEWSRQIFEAELSEFYAAAVQHRAGAMPDLPLQYADYARWQREIVNGDALRSQTDYWVRQLEDAPELLALPTDRPRPAEQTFRGASMHFRLPDSLAQGVRALSRSDGATPYMVLLAAFTALLHRYSGSDDIVVGAPAATRTHAELERLIGYFVNILPLRTHVHSRVSFRNHLRHVREVALAAYRHQEVPFEALVDRLRDDRAVNQMPLVQVIFEMHAQDRRAFRIGDVLATRELATTGTSKFDMTWSIYDEGDGLRGWIEFSADLFDAATLDRMVGHYERLLAGFLEDPDRPIDDPVLTTRAELDQLVAWSGGDGDGSGDPPVHELVAAQSDRTPDAVAVTFEGVDLTYRDLDRRVDRLAQRLLGLGISPGTPVGICVQRSPDLVIAVLAVLRAGGAYVPLDPDHPSRRLAYQIQDVRPPVVLTQRRTEQHLPDTAARIVRIDDVDAAPGDRRPSCRVGSEHPAYVLYTSGSTGRPKGVVVPHRAVTTRLSGMQETTPLDPTDVVLHKTTLTFDVSVWELLWPLTIGARLVLARPGGQRDNDYLVDLIRREGVTTTHFVPSSLAYVLRQPDLGACKALRRVFCGGEPLPADVRDRFFELLGDVELHHLYGPTETCIDVTYTRCRRVDRHRWAPIGRPVAGTQVRILDARGQMTPIGVPGELCVGGQQVAHGYVSQPALTAVSFVPDPFETSGERLYRTGDLARWLPNGVVEFLGRKDDQLKVRGHRIEPGEIESMLAEHPAVGECAVVARAVDGENDGERRLVAYVVASHNQPASGELKEFLASGLPSYMIPSAVVFVTELPRHPSGKLDRIALPEPDYDRSAAGAAYVAPSTSLEKLLAELQSDVLGVGQIGIHDNFFRIGGDSFSAVRLGARVEAALGRRLPATVVFRAPTIADLARWLGDEQGRAG